MLSLLLTGPGVMSPSLSAAPLFQAVDHDGKIEARYDGTWELPAIGVVTAPVALLIRPDGYVAWVGDLTQLRLADALTTWFGPPTAV